VRRKGRRCRGTSVQAEIKNVIKSPDKVAAQAGMDELLNARTIVSAAPPARSAAPSRIPVRGKICFAERGQVIRAMTAGSSTFIGQPPSRAGAMAAASAPSAPTAAAITRRPQGGGCPQMRPVMYKRSPSARKFSTKIHSAYTITFPPGKSVAYRAQRPCRRVRADPGEKVINLFMIKT